MLRVLCLVVVLQLALSKSVQKQANVGDFDMLFGGPSARQDPVPILGGPSARQLDFGNLFETDLTTDAKFEEAVKAAAAQKLREQQTPSENLFKREASNIVTCVYCDNRCVASAQASGYTQAKDYFDVAIGEMNRIVQDPDFGLDSEMSFELKFLMLPYTITEMSWFFDYSVSTSEELLTAINNKFWADTGLYNTATGNGCDVDFLVGAQLDPAWQYMGSVQGIANMFQLCLKAYSTVSMNSNPILTAKLMTHEFGHMIGMYHDGSLNSAFTGMASYFDAGNMLADCAGKFATLQGSCTAGDSGCNSGKCIMAPTVDGTEFSGCSLAYYDMFKCLVDVMPTFYSDNCIKV